MTAPCKFGGIIGQISRLLWLLTTLTLFLTGGKEEEGPDGPVLWNHRFHMKAEDSDKFIKSDLLDEGNEGYILNLAGEESEKRPQWEDLMIDCFV